MNKVYGVCEMCGKESYVELTDETDIKNINKTLDLLDDDDDVQNVYHNWDE